MKIAIISDVHGNYEALSAVLADLAGRPYDLLISLGDNIGYGPEPEQVLVRMQMMNILSVAGNHERAMFDSQAYDGLNFQAQENNLRTRAMLSPESLLYCQAMPDFWVQDRAYFVHGFPPDSFSRYLYEVPDEEIREYLAGTGMDVCFVGHTHRPALLEVEDGQLITTKLGEGHFVLDPCRSYIVNVGSVGQPRGKDRRAQYVLWDSLSHELQVICLSYDPLPTMKKIRALGFSENYASRLQ
ncbi:metallophosphoesterase family protein [Desulfotalea psychrophila]|uniref:Calcineurin-like phosphoesterase domain-containing protein n=1 Tax=Desulfotalea psychrophila (strain LSv54 / DSM 12343) TaxID=177439 RepID=Q6APJ4_DESPS|nr:metallophosphoesterase family protein [Desulfotalea psychrophila]CAG35730.1 conserved hypothetical protein [Desulfotalea psychrophila LSv54]